MSSYGQSALVEQLTPKQLMELSERLYTSFQPERMTIDAHADECVKAWKVHNDDDATFMRQVFYGCIRFQKLLNVAMSAFYFHNSGTVLRSDVHMYTVYAYLTLLRLEELSFGQYQRLVKSQDPQKMIVFLSFVFDERVLLESCRDEWLKLYDIAFVDELIRQVLVFLPEVAQLRGSLEEQVYLSKKKEEEEAAAWQSHGTVKHTVPKPFNLTESRPRPLPAPDDLGEVVRPKPVPPMREGPTLEMKAVELAKAENRKQLAAKYSDPAKQPFQLRTLERPSNLERIKSQVEEERLRELTFQPKASKPVPAAPSASVKLNAAAVLREDALYKKKQDQEARMIKAYEEELRDGREFELWKHRMRELDEEQRREEIEERRREMKAAEEAALQARLEKVESNHALVVEMRAEAREMERAREQELEAFVEEKRGRRDVVVEARKGIKVAQEALSQERRALYEAAVQERTELARKLAEEKALEHARKMDLVRQLRALEAVPQETVTHFDPTSTPGHGLLEEMSLAELKERIAIAKSRASQEEELRREEIVAHKKEKASVLEAKAANISRIRSQAATSAAQRRAAAADRTRKHAHDEAAEQERGVRELMERREQKKHAQRLERDKLEAEQKMIKVMQQRQAATKGLVEETKFRELSKGAERELKAKQAGAKQTATAYEDIKQRERAILTKNVKQGQKHKRDFVKLYDDKVRALAELDAAAKAEELEYKRTLVAAEHERADKQANHFKTNLISPASFVHHHSTNRGAAAAAATGSSSGAGATAKAKHALS
eukprot:CAMPEP_0170144934 /NCGR_PEP_ID=MMETSP0033_2-20121228/16248_1 /TAXON_ID=195969 /ORGANISM="Dolichomastix tenuilepis, Strain CCMP3274" /LENGTH=781 /DNA_ID=CAMNT_0010381465 /DNA_START=178 /DNA_END=2526 /DNA_ORIENTATION=-